MSTLQINEIFGPTVQGEGAAAGRHCLFVRTANCNLRCTWCDTAYTWAFNEALAANLEKPEVFDKSENLKEMTHEEVWEQLNRLWYMESDPTMVVVSGGEPLMQARQLEDLAIKLNDYDHQLHIETAGTLRPTDILHNLVGQYNVSPKLEHSGNRDTKRYKPDVLQFFAGLDNAWFKFVLRDVKDFDEVDWIVSENNIDPHHVMVMPEGVTAEKNMEIAKLLVDPAIQRGYGLSYRTHILLWKDVRGK